MHRVLFVCMGNICRSPPAEGVFRQLVKTHNLESSISTDSAGTGGWHIGNPPDRRAQSTASHRGIDISDLRARQVVRSDLHEFDTIIAMDHSNLRNLEEMLGAAMNDKTHLLLEFADEFVETEIPDPYYGGDDGFDRVLDMIEAGCNGLLAHIRTQN